MVFNVTISLSGLKTQKGKSYSIMIADTIIVRPNGPEVLTGKIPKKYEEISYALQDGEEPEVKKKAPAPAAKQTSKELYSIFCL